MKMLLLISKITEPFLDFPSTPVPMQLLKLNISENKTMCTVDHKTTSYNVDRYEQHVLVLANHFSSAKSRTQL